MAYRKIDFDLTDEKTHNQFKEMCALQCTMEEICGIFNISKDTLRDRIKKAFGPEVDFPTIFKDYSAGGKMSLRRCQFKLAQKSAAMAIFLGKNYLNQVDVKTLDDVNKPITITWKDADASAQDQVKIKVPATKGSAAEQ